MRNRFFASIGTLAAAMLLMSLAQASVRGQAAAKDTTTKSARTSAGTKGAFVTSWGDPDLEGVWSNATTTPLERPGAVGEKDVLSDEETSAEDQKTAESRNTDRRDGKGTDADVSRAYNEFWWERGKSIGRTSLIVDPPDGRIPALTLEGQKSADALAAARRSRGPADSWTDRNLHERCIVYHSVPPLPTGYNNNYQIEYACHEGNYGMAGILSGHRAQERTTAGARKKVACRLPARPRLVEFLFTEAEQAPNTPSGAKWRSQFRQARATP